MQEISTKTIQDERDFVCESDTVAPNNACIHKIRLVFHRVLCLSRSMTDVTKVIGDMGPWQGLVAGFVMISNFFLAFNTISSAFILPSEQRFWCVEDAFFQNRSQDDVCRRYEDADSKLCRRVSYDRTVYRKTLTEEYDLVCGRTWVRTVVQSSVMAGVMLGTVAFGYVSDRRGRRCAVYTGALLHAAGCIVALLANNYVQYVLARLLLSLGTSSSYSFDVIFIESVAPRYRFVSSVAISFGYTAGAIVVAVLNLTVQDWRAYHGLMILYSVLLLVFWYLLHESPRWLLCKKRFDDAEEVMTKICTFNGIPKGKVKVLFPHLLRRYEPAVTHPSSGLLDLFRSSKGTAVYTLCVWFQAVILAFIYYTSSLTGTVLGGKPHFDFICLFTVEFLCNLLCALLSKRVPRKLFMCGMCVLLAAAMAVLAVFQYKVYVVNLVASLVVKGAVSSFILIFFLHVHETYPTRFRAIGYGAFQLVYWASASVEPFVRTAATSVSPSLLPGVYGCGVLASALSIACVLKETITKQLSDDVEDNEVETGNVGSGAFAVNVHGTVERY
ncbi:organic cation transporter protein-like [Ornithodoros turicata]|uniref:organic cation transporter protein-like n=1 Tax=Ornithodoros turicata TaxID=34597 RepID=UPI0031398B92